MNHGPPKLPPGPLYGEPEPFQPVWVNLDLLYPNPPEGTGRLVVDGLDTTGEAPGVVHNWLRAAHGLWIACCTYQLPYVDGRTNHYRAERQLVPATALRKRDAS